MSRAKVGTFALLLTVGLLVLPRAAPSQAASSIANPNVPNVWIVDANGELSYSQALSVFPDWSLYFDPFGTGNPVHFESGADISIPYAGSPDALFVNQLLGSDPAPTATPDVSFKGLADAVTSDLSAATFILTPPPGAGYTQTMRVQIQVLPPRLGGTLPYLVEGDVNGNPFGGSHPRAAFFLVEGVYTVNYHFVGGAGIGPTHTVQYTVTSSDIMRDSDGDGVPDLFEALHGFNPLEAGDLFADSDNDGVSDFDEVIRGSDPATCAFSPGEAGFDSCRPTDSDGDGAFDWDELRHGTDPNDPVLMAHPDHPDILLVDKPASRRLSEVEYVIDGASQFWLDGGQTVAQTAMSGLTASDVLWNPAYDQAWLPDVSVFTAPMNVESYWPPQWRASDAAAALAAGNLPLMRLPAGEPIILRAEHLDITGLPDGWVAKAWLPSQPDVHPQGVFDYLAGLSQSFATAAEWETAYSDYFASAIVQQVTIDLSPRSHLGTALVESAIDWYDALQGEGFVLLGEATSPTSLSAIAALRQTMGPVLDESVIPSEVLEAGRSLSALHDELESLTAAGQVLAPFAAAVDAIYAAPGALIHPTTVHATASLLQGDPSDDIAQARYIARLVAGTPLADILALPPAEQAALFDPDADVDLDGIPNAAELAPDPELASEVEIADADGDGLSDAGDPCPNDGAHGCLLHDYLVMDSDGDGHIDSLDNCMNDFNTDQTDANDDGIGDLCERYWNIRTPVANLRIYAGMDVDFTAIDTGLCAQLGGCGSVTFSWDFDGGAANQAAHSPGAIAFATPGIYEVSFTADASGQPALAPDVRRIIVQALAAPPIASAGGPYGVVEGDSLQLSASASSPGGGTIDSYDWDFADGGVGAGNPVGHTWASQGDRTVSLRVAKMPPPCLTSGSTAGPPGRAPR